MNANTPKETVPSFLVAPRLRAVVLALGESVRPSWWNTEFMSEPGFRFLERLYPRTFFNAAIHAAGVAACNVHDRAVGRVGVFHLFRLPETMEIEMVHSPISIDDKFLTQFRTHLGHPDELTRMLASLCVAKSNIKHTVGAVRIGSESDLTAPDILNEMAVAYHHAFSNQKQMFPYLESK